MAIDTPITKKKQKLLGNATTAAATIARAGSISLPRSQLLFKNWFLVGLHILPPPCLTGRTQKRGRNQNQQA